jgi:hypothetical protein
LRRVEKRRIIGGRERTYRQGNSAMAISLMDKVLQRLIIEEPSTLPTGCWMWPGKQKRDGYGIVQHEGKDIRVHRAVYEHFQGAIPKGRVLHHRCRNRPCANFEHLEPCGIMENVRKDHPDIDGKAGRKKTHCVHGHPLSGPNLVIDRCGFRSCRECRHAAKDRYKARLRETHGKSDRLAGLSE